MAKLKFLKVKGSWREVADAARTTIRREEGTGEPSPRWKKRILLAEHSPIRKLCFNWKWEDLPSWVSVHFVRHKFGIEHFVSTQRSDRTGQDRAAARQDAPVVHECFANAQAVLFISRRRLCGQASPETRAAWRLVVDAIAEKEPEVAECCVPECVYRGFCPEFRPCGFCGTPAFEKAVAKYRDVPPPPPPSAKAKKGQAALEYVLALAALLAVVSVLGFLVTGAVRFGSRTEGLVSCEYP